MTKNLAPKKTTKNQRLTCSLISFNDNLSGSLTAQCYQTLGWSMITAIPVSASAAPAMSQPVNLIFST